MSTTPRLPAREPGQRADFTSIMAHAPAIPERFNALYAEFWQQGLVASTTKEMTRIRNARITDCGF